jgi:hypothetical protein
MLAPRAAARRRPIMHASITLTPDESPGHSPVLPVIDLPADPAPDVKIWFQDSEGDQIVLVGCRACLASQFAALAAPTPG